MMKYSGLKYQFMLERTEMEVDSVPIVNDTKKGTSSTGVSSKNVPTLDVEVRAELRKLGHPITYFGEDNADRRERLIKILSEQHHTNFDFDYVMEEDNEPAKNGEFGSENEDDEDDDEDFYTPGSQELYEARVNILHFSLKRARNRVREQQQISKNQNFIKILKHRRHINSVLSRYELYGSQIIQGNTRALSAVRFSKNDSLIACGSWDGGIYILNKSDLKTMYTSASGYHTEKASAIDWDIYTESNHLVSGGNEGNVQVWKVPEEKVGTTAKLKPSVSINGAHDARVTRTLFHPTGSFIASTSFDQTWKLWDINRPEEALLQQEGHSKEIFAGSFHQDGSLFATGGLDAIGRVWDLRSGRSIATLEGHIKGIYSIDWSPNGYHLATASGDCSVKIWDVRRLQRGNGEAFSIPAHTKIVSEVRYFSRRDKNDILSTEVTGENGEDASTLDSNGTFLATSSYDGLVNIWSADNFVKVKSLKGHNDKVMSCDISGDGSTIVSSGWDRSVKLWSK
ncbi:WD40-repeat-containing domain protein [Scheffersomyces xylosifermentans]|uniref:WD40-repeat-containing domain protein n=1 Tax=Scheffersomyces xylosifermentans TaxID=1304137 RepID=UPI00315D1F6F